ncbi:hypothetical protein ACJ2_25210 [Pantoea sp. QMID2]|nr:hypothetical protein ACJ3_28800 [Pantoea sp. QMID3]GME42239.1 hypothetical protein ACJ1_29920 [Pantoea sp. QMID1]GME57445.1 hypothetical protein ACJ4_26420 [Pantoea sp. QMID4]GME58296.1 hypothetical protein ACJ2_25210 [Pantoea sp. QMID2]
MVAGHFPVELTGHSGHANAQTLKNIERDNGFSFFKTGREQQGNILIHKKFFYIVGVYGAKNVNPGLCRHTVY